MHSAIKDTLYSIFGKDKYISWDMGKTNILLSAPHGGGIKPITIPKRKYGNLSQDTYTRRLITGVVGNFKNKPYYVYADIHRSRIDFNRNIKEACQGNKKMEDEWKKWNKLLYTMSHEIINLYKRGLYVDIHSHNLGDKFQIGYGVSARVYNDLRNGWNLKEKTTLDSLMDSEDKKWTMLFGEGSFINSINSYGYEVLIPFSDKSYLSGGRNIRDFCGYGIGAVQIECPISVMKYDFNGILEAVTNSIRMFRASFLDNNSGQKL